MNTLSAVARIIWKQTGIVIMGPVLTLMAVIWFREPLYGLLQEQAYVTIHLIIEIFIIVVSFTIATQAWMIFPHTLSNHRLWLGALFFATGFLGIFHTITYEGMPFFIYESSSYRSTWFYLVMRITLAVVLLLIVLSEERQINPRQRWIAYLSALLFVAAWVGVLFVPGRLLPELVIIGEGTTLLSNSLQYGSLAVQLGVAVIIAFQFRERQLFNGMLILASVYFGISDIQFTLCESDTDLSSFTGHLFQVAGYYFLLRALYHSSVEEPFLKRKEAEAQLHNHEHFLQTVTSNLGEGLLVLDVRGRLTFMNPEAERQLQWKEAELIGKRVHDIIHDHREDGSYYSYEDCPQTLTLASGHTYRITDDLFIRKDHSSLPVSYVSSPYMENGQIAGSIMIFHDITLQKNNQETIRYMAYYDELTGLPNLRFFKEKLSEAIARNQSFAVLLMNIERFNHINESLGHAFGDLLLKNWAQHLTQAFPEHNINRMGGDNFVILVSSSDVEMLGRLCEKIQEYTREPLRVQHLSLNLRVNIGVSRFPDNGDDGVALLKYANIAMWEAKTRNERYSFYDPSQGKASWERLILENDLHQALERGELYVVYQPQADCRTGLIVAVEALIRWRHPIRGEVSPCEFIPIAEESGLIVPIGEWVLRTACYQLKAWHDKGLTLIGISVNLSNRQFYQQNLVQVVKDILQETGLSPYYLELEITESMTMNSVHAMEMLKAFKEIGVSISVDDFGTGYSSLAYLKQLPIGRLKIDQSFIRDLVTDKDNEAIVSMIISMARHLHLTVIAEGVETREQLLYLRENGCHQIQGYLISQPVPAGIYERDFRLMQAGATNICR